MPTHLVNLDALIVREDFEVTAETERTPGSPRMSLTISELGETSNTYRILRKPDFQRETGNWNPSTVMELVRCFLDGDLIPAVILWRSPDTGNIFVIDGAHRLSALMAWVHNDYGDGKISREFLANFIPREQLRAASETRELIDGKVGSFDSLRAALVNPANSPDISVRRAKNMAVFQVDCQWVQGDARKAEASFFTINQKAAPIHPTELRVLQSRRKPNALAARALIHAGVGHKYWSAFAKETQIRIESTAREVYDIMFEPPLETPIKTLDLPVAGRGYSANSFQLVFEFVNYVNNCGSASLPDDKNGLETIKFLERARRMAARISGDHPGSLGLHPVVYFYSATGRYQPAAFLAVVQFFEYLDAKNLFIGFTRVRNNFEEFLLKYRFLLNQIVRKYGSGTRASPAITLLYTFLFTGMIADKTEEQIVSELLAHPDLRFLKLSSEYEKATDGKMGSSQKSAAFLRSTIDNAPKCQICGARIHRKSISFDHRVRVQDGGSGDSDNAQLTHPFCNSGFKERDVNEQRSQPPTA